MKKLLFILTVLFIATSITGCSNEEVSNSTIEEKIENNLFTIELKSMENMPNWLVSYIEKLESYDAPTQVDEAIFQFTWRDQTMYFHNTLFSPTQIEHVFYSDGTRVDWTKVDREDVAKNGKDLILIYKIIRMN